jgi:hypothetical protein
MLSRNLRWRRAIQLNPSSDDGQVGLYRTISKVERPHDALQVFLAAGVRLGSVRVFAHIAGSFKVGLTERFLDQIVAKSRQQVLYLLGWWGHMKMARVEVPARACRR